MLYNIILNEMTNEEFIKVILYSSINNKNIWHVFFFILNVYAYTMYFKYFSLNYFVDLISLLYLSLVLYSFMAHLFVIQDIFTF